MDCCATYQHMIMALGMIVLGFVLTGTGVLFDFNRVMLVPGNTLLLLGFISACGFEHALIFFLRRRQRFMAFYTFFPGLICLAFGFFCVVNGSTMIGMILELCGAIALLWECLLTQVVAPLRSPVNFSLVCWFILVISVVVIEFKYKISLSNFAPHL